MKPEAAMYDVRGQVRLTKTGEMALIFRTRPDVAVADELGLIVPPEVVKSF
jgi:hypothetical protein